MELDPSDRALFDTLCHQVLKEAWLAAGHGPRPRRSVLNALSSMSDESIRSLIDIYESMVPSHGHTVSQLLTADAPEDRPVDDAGAEDEVGVDEAKEDDSVWSAWHGTAWEDASWWLTSSKAEEWEVEGAWWEGWAGSGRHWHSNTWNADGETRSTKLYVGNLPNQIDEDEINELFRPFGYIKDIHIMQGRSYSTWQSCAIVVYYDHAASEKCLEEMSAGKEIRTGEGNLVVKYADDQGPLSCRGQAKARAKGTGRWKGKKNFPQLQ